MTTELWALRLQFEQREAETTITGGRNQTQSRKQNRYNDAEQRQVMLQEKDAVLQKSSQNPVV